ncbi:hypothetical protein GLOTRDRAFT_52076 [Gloeophyllum trabeum ATCC 11539]|uniref:BHLH domain-containing protein n=1 Tax=Gloeophyllum trabeum (strain ATCC 11539 / FP-39264 / Madison 617) TaxID=670483 RepID=S7RYW6_GLOTA|nr:uncharacterized protein GLOTRDRAFT_52076 [Gloeophyllum trabeum ATCC 11539]EPQ60155.1 hypothetical protein GLOTRDRAFT_52076 [Gloeophyllum trabeum ATCC 11539]
MEAHLEHVLEHPKSPAFMDATSNFTYDPMLGLDYIQYPPNSPFGLSSQNPSSPRMGFTGLNLASGLGDYPYSSGTYTTPSPGRPFTPSDSASIYPAALSNMSGGELSSDGMTTGRRNSRGSGTHSPASSASLAAVPRSHRFNPLGGAMPPARTTSRKRRAKVDEFGSDDEDDGDFVPSSNSKDADVRREEIRRQRIESEQRRRDELREGYRRLKDALPVSNQKSSKVCLLDRATTHIKYLEMTNQQLTARVQQAESEMQRLRQVNEALMLGTAEQRHAAAAAAAAAVGAPQSQGF